MSNGYTEVVVIGNIGIDTNVYMPADTPGRSIDLARDVSFTENLDGIGHAGGFAARGYARLGRRTAFIGHVGDDPQGRVIRAALARARIDITGLFVDPRGTARSVNLVFPDGQRKSFYDGKGHMTLKPDAALCRAILSGSRLAHFNIPNWARELLPVARAQGMVIACDLQDVDDPRDPYRADFIEHADVLFCSAANHADPEALLRALVAMRPDAIVVMGMGARGCGVGTRDGVRFYPPVSLDMPVVDTNGAGDGLAVGFLISHVFEGRSVDESIHRGQIVARYICGLRAGNTDFITAADLERYASATAR